VTHLSDEAVAAHADGMLTGLARERARRHTEACAECARAVRVQREAALRLRTAAAPPLPTDLLARLRAVPTSTPLSGPPTVVAPDGTRMFPAYPLPPAGRSPFGGMAPMAAFAPSAPAAPAQPQQHHHRARPLARVAVVAAAVGAVAVVSTASAAGAGGSAQPHDPPPAHFVSR
jgi:anti-sigma factor RsiW